MGNELASNRNSVAHYHYGSTSDLTRSPLLVLSSSDGNNNMSSANNGSSSSSGVDGGDASSPSPSPSTTTAPPSSPLSSLPSRARSQSNSLLISSFHSSSSLLLSTSPPPTPLSTPLSSTPLSAASSSTSFMKRVSSRSKLGTDEPPLEVIMLNRLRHMVVDHELHAKIFDTSQSTVTTDTHSGGSFNNGVSSSIHHNHHNHGNYQHQHQNNGNGGASINNNMSLHPLSTYDTTSSGGSAGTSNNSLGTNHLNSSGGHNGSQTSNGGMNNNNNNGHRTVSSPVPFRSPSSHYYQFNLPSPSQLPIASSHSSSSPSYIYSPNSPPTTLMGKVSPVGHYLSAGESSASPIPLYEQQQQQQQQNENTLAHTPVGPDSHRFRSLSNVLKSNPLSIKPLKFNMEDIWDDDDTTRDAYEDDDYTDTWSSNVHTSMNGGNGNRQIISSPVMNPMEELGDLGTDDVTANTMTENTKKSKPFLMRNPIKALRKQKMKLEELQAEKRRVKMEKRLQKQRELAKIETEQVLSSSEDKTLSIDYWASYQRALIRINRNHIRREIRRLDPLNKYVLLRIRRHYEMELNSKHSSKKKSIFKLFRKSQKKPDIKDSRSALEKSICEIRQTKDLSLVHGLDLNCLAPLVPEADIARLDKELAIAPDCPIDIETHQDVRAPVKRLILRWINSVIVHYDSIPELESFDIEWTVSSVRHIYYAILNLYRLPQPLPECHLFKDEPGTEIEQHYIHEMAVLILSIELFKELFNERRAYEKIVDFTKFALLYHDTQHETAMLNEVATRMQSIPRNLECVHNVHNLKYATRICQSSIKLNTCKATLAEKMNALRVLQAMIRSRGRNAIFSNTLVNVKHVQSTVRFATTFDIMLDKSRSQRIICAYVVQGTQDIKSTKEATVLQGSIQQHQIGNVNMIQRRLIADVLSNIRFASRMRTLQTEVRDVSSIEALLYSSLQKESYSTIRYVCTLQALARRFHLKSVQDNQVLQLQASCRNHLRIAERLSLLRNVIIQQSSTRVINCQTPHRLSRSSLCLLDSALRGKNQESVRRSQIDAQVFLQNSSRKHLKEMHYIYEKEIIHTIQSSIRTCFVRQSCIPMSDSVVHLQADSRRENRMSLLARHIGIHQLSAVFNCHLTMPYLHNSVDTFQGVLKTINHVNYSRASIFSVNRMVAIINRAQNVNIDEGCRMCTCICASIRQKHLQANDINNIIGIQRTILQCSNSVDLVGLPVIQSSIRCINSKQRTSDKLRGSQWFMAAIRSNAQPFSTSSIEHLQNAMLSIREAHVAKHRLNTLRRLFTVLHAHEGRTQLDWTSPCLTLQSTIRSFTNGASVLFGMNGTLRVQSHSGSMNQFSNKTISQVQSIGRTATVESIRFMSPLLDTATSMLDLSDLYESMQVVVYIQAFFRRSVTDRLNIKPIQSISRSSTSTLPINIEPWKLQSHCRSSLCLIDTTPLSKISGIVRTRVTSDSLLTFSNMLDVAATVGKMDDFGKSVLDVSHLHNCIRRCLQAQTSDRLTVDKIRAVIKTGNDDSSSISMVDTLQCIIRYSTVGVEPEAMPTPRSHKRNCFNAMSTQIAVIQSLFRTRLSLIGFCPIIVIQSVTNKTRYAIPRIRVEELQSAMRRCHGNGIVNLTDKLQLFCTSWLCAFDNHELMSIQCRIRGKLDSQFFQPSSISMIAKTIRATSETQQVSQSMLRLIHPIQGIVCARRAIHCSGSTIECLQAAIRGSLSDPFNDSLSLLRATILKVLLSMHINDAHTNQIIVSAVSKQSLCQIEGTLEVTSTARSAVHYSDISNAGMNIRKLQNDVQRQIVGVARNQIQQPNTTKLQTATRKEMSKFDILSDCSKLLTIGSMTSRRSTINSTDITLCMITCIQSLIRTAHTQRSNRDMSIGFASLQAAFRSNEHTTPSLVNGLTSCATATIILSGQIDMHLSLKKLSAVAAKRQNPAIFSSIGHIQDFVSKLKVEEDQADLQTIQDTTTSTIKNNCLRNSIQYCIHLQSIMRTALIPQELTPEVIQSIIRGTEKYSDNQVQSLQSIFRNINQEKQERQQVIVLQCISRNVSQQNIWDQLLVSQANIRSAEVQFIPPQISVLQSIFVMNQFPSPCSPLTSPILAGFRERDQYESQTNVLAVVCRSQQLYIQQMHLLVVQAAIRRCLLVQSQQHQKSINKLDVDVVALQSPIRTSLYGKDERITQISAHLRTISLEHAEMKSVNIIQALTDQSMIPVESIYRIQSVHRTITPHQWDQWNISTLQASILTPLTNEQSEASCVLTRLNAVSILQSCLRRYNIQGSMDLQAKLKLQSVLSATITRQNIAEKRIISNAMKLPMPDSKEISSVGAFLLSATESRRLHEMIAEVSVIACSILRAARSEPMETDIKDITYVQSLAHSKNDPHPHFLSIIPLQTLIKQNDGALIQKNMEIHTETICSVSRLLDKQLDLQHRNDFSGLISTLCGSRLSLCDDLIQTVIKLQGLCQQRLLYLGDGFGQDPIQATIRGSNTQNTIPNIIPLLATLSTSCVDVVEIKYLQSVVRQRNQTMTSKPSQFIKPVQSIGRLSLDRKSRVNDMLHLIQALVSSGLLPNGTLVTCIIAVIRTRQHSLPSHPILCLQVVFKTRLAVQPNHSLLGSILRCALEYGKQLNTTKLILDCQSIMRTALSVSSHSHQTIQKKKPLQLTNRQYIDLAMNSVSVVNNRSDMTKISKSSHLWHKYTVSGLSTQTKFEWHRSVHASCLVHGLNLHQRQQNSNQSGEQSRK